MPQPPRKENRADREAWPPWAPSGRVAGPQQRTMRTPFPGRLSSQSFEVHGRSTGDRAPRARLLTTSPRPGGGGFPPGGIGRAGARGGLGSVDGRSFHLPNGTIFGETFGGLAFDADRLAEVRA